MNTHKLKDISNLVRREAVDQIYKSRIGNIGGVMSAVELIVYLYYEFLNIDPKDPEKNDRDRFILSKGQAAPTLYSVLSSLGYFHKSELPTFRQLDSNLQTHPELGKLPGIDFSSGSLGQGLSAGVGMCLAMRRKNIVSRVVVMLGDGELQEGQVWEAVMSASHYELSNLILIIDNNKLQDYGFTDEIMSIMPLDEKFKSFGWDVISCDGHNFESIDKAFNFEKSSNSPLCIIAETIKGKGIDFMENSPKWHGIQNMTEEQYEEINKSLNNQE